MGVTRLAALEISLAIDLEMSRNCQNTKFPGFRLPVIKKDECIAKILASVMYAVWHLTAIHQVRT